MEPRHDHLFHPSLITILIYAYLELPNHCSWYTQLRIFMKIWYFSIFLKSTKKFQVLLKSDQNSEVLYINTYVKKVKQSH
jgi:hypothetical protein